MGFREIRPQASKDISELFENAEQMEPLIRKTAPIQPVKLDSHFRLPGWDTKNVVTKKRFSLPTIDTSRYKELAIALLKVGVGCFLIWFGATSSGSAFGPVSGKFGGYLAQVFYTFQVGNLLAMVGILCIYDAINRYR